MKNKIVFVIAFFVCLSFFGNIIGTVKAADEDIAQEYAPIFYFEKDETCFPVDVSYHIENSFLYIVDQVNPIDTSLTIDSLPTDDNHYYLDNQKGTIEDDGIINEYKSKNLGYTVYSHVFESGGLTRCKMDIGVPILQRLDFRFPHGIQEVQSKHHHHGRRLMREPLPWFLDTD